MVPAIVIFASALWLVACSANEPEPRLPPQPSFDVVEGNERWSIVHEFRPVRSVSGETFAMFGGSRASGSAGDVNVPGVPIAKARAMARRDPDFFMCRSGNKFEVLGNMKFLSIYPADRIVYDRLVEIVEEFDRRSRGGGARLCLTIRGRVLKRESHVPNHPWPFSMDDAGSAYRWVTGVRAEDCELSD